MEDEGLNEKQITVASVLPSSAGNTGTQGLTSAITEAWAYPPPCSPGVAESDTAAGTDIDELMLSAAHTSSHLLLDSHFLPPMKAYKELHLRSII